jgi:hypothetical protein
MECAVARHEIAPMVRTTSMIIQFAEIGRRIEIYPALPAVIADAAMMDVKTTSSPVATVSHRRVNALST